MSWVLGEASAAVRRWTELGLEPPPLTVNASTIEATELPQAALTEAALRDSDVAPAALRLELPNGVLAGRGLLIQHELQALHALGVGLSVDVSDLDIESLERAAAFAIFDIKIDLRSTASPRRREQAARVVKEARSLGLIVTAKRAETLQDLALLESLGCQRVQGYSFGAPMSAAEIEELLGARRSGQTGATNGEHGGSDRSNPRVPLLSGVERVVRVPATGGATQLLGAMLVDLSEGGMQLRLADSAEVGDELRLVLTPSASIEPIEVRLEAVAVRDLQGTYGVHGPYLELPLALPDTIAREVARRGRSAAA